MTTLAFTTTPRTREAIAWAIALGIAALGMIWGAGLLQSQPETGTRVVAVATSDGRHYGDGDVVTPVRYQYAGETRDGLVSEPLAAGEKATVTIARDGTITPEPPTGWQRTLGLLAGGIVGALAGALIGAATLAALEKRARR